MHAALVLIMCGAGVCVLAATRLREELMLLGILLAMMWGGLPSEDATQGFAFSSVLASMGPLPLRLLRGRGRGAPPDRTRVQCSWGWLRASSRPAR